jgi:hypothetical protein
MLFDWQFAVVLAIVGLAVRQIVARTIRTWMSPGECSGCSSGGCQKSDGSAFELVSLDVAPRLRVGGELDSTSS